jgi:hypothetical protein
MLELLCNYKISTTNYKDSSYSAWWRGLLDGYILSASKVMGREIDSRQGIGCRLKFFIKLGKILGYAGSGKPYL